MCSLGPRQSAELAFWRGLFAEKGDGYVAYRSGIDFIGKVRFFPDLLAETGRGLDYGCGLVSVFEGSDLDMDACDPLLSEYDAIYRHEGRVRYLAEPSGPYDFICCFNVIDHDPEPDAIAKGIAALLAPGGRLYFEVNFDPVIDGIAHPVKWTREQVEIYLLSRFTLVREQVEDDPVWIGRQFYRAVFVLPCGT